MDSQLIFVALAGFFASLVDGALGMGFGPTSASILLSAGVSPSAASASINLAKIFTGIASAVSHWKAGNTQRRLVIRLAAPGAVGAAIGATVLANVDGDALRPWLAGLLVLVGLRILVRFAFADLDGVRDDEHGPATTNVTGVEIAAVSGGVTNGLIGAWGPVVTPFLLHRRVPPRFAVGCVNTAEVAVAIVAAGTLFTATGGEGIRGDVVVAMLLGGVAASPVAAVVVRHIHPRTLGLAVAALLLFTQCRELANTSELPGNRWTAYGVVLALVMLAALTPRIRTRFRPSSGPAGDYANTRTMAASADNALTTSTADRRRSPSMRSAKPREP
jgi:uncharacterized membrane protein YfcA